MKHCPVCNTDFDDSVVFCENDGHKFEEASSELAITEPCPLSALISAQAPFEIKRAVQLAIRICDSAEELRRNGRVVGFLRPEDVLVTDQDKEQVRILLPELTEEPSASKGRLREFANYISPEVAQQEAGRAGYISPEPEQSESADIRSAVYCIGAILYEMIAGRPPFIASSPAAVIVKQLLERPRPLRDLRPDVPEELQRVVMRALEKERPARQQSCAELRQELETAINKYDVRESVTAKPETRTQARQEPLTPKDEADNLIGTVLDDKYRIEEKIGEGGMGKVYRATHIHIGHTVAIKMLYPSLATDQTAIGRFRREALAAVQLHHPNTIAITDFGVTKDTGIAYLVMEFLAGIELRHMIKERKQLDYEETFIIVQQICSALEAAHSKGIIHSDLKPDNIELLETEGDIPRVKVLEFGMAKLKTAAESNQLTQQGMIFGTPYYMSPEQCRGEELDARSDIYSLGTILYEMLTGQVPFKLQSLTPVGVVLRITQEPPRPPSELRPDMPKPVEAVILRALAKRREHRQESALQLAQELEHTLREAGIKLKVIGANTPQSISSPPFGDRSISPESVGLTSAPQPSGTLSPDLAQTGAHAIYEKEASKGLFQNIPRLLLIGLPILAILGFIILSFTFTLSATESDSGADYPLWLFAAILLAIGISVAIYLLARRRKPSAPVASVPLPETQPRLPSPLDQETLGPPPESPQDTTIKVKAPQPEKATAQEKTEPIAEKSSPSYYDLQPLEISKQCPKCGENYPASKKYCHNDGQRLIDVKKDKPEEMEPVLIGQYKCFARLGEGGMGIVYKAQHIHLDRLSAVKVLLPQIAAMLPNAVQMFRREARLASSINHPNSVIIYDYGEVGTSLFYLAMEFIHGESLAQIITPKDQPSHPLSLSRAFDITKQICDALDTAHQLGIVHRDLKPQNVMICKKANGKDLVKVLDFGIARSLKGKGDFQTTPGTIMGTPAYMSPEQANGLPDLDARSDIFSLGLIVYEMLSGKLPFQTSGLTPVQQVLRRASLTIPPPLLSSFAKDLMIPASVDQVLMRALEPNRDRRTQSIKEFVDDLETATH